MEIRTMFEALCLAPRPEPAGAFAQLAALYPHAKTLDALMRASRLEPWVIARLLEAAASRQNQETN